MSCRWARVAWLVLLLSGHAGAVEVSTPNLQLKFSDNGDLLSAQSCLPTCADIGSHIRVLGEGGALVSFTSYASELFELTRQEDEHDIRLTFANQANGSLREWKIPRGGFQLAMTSLGASQIHIQAGKSLVPPDSAGFAYWLEQQRYVLIEDGDVSQLGLEEPPESRAIGDWSGFRNRFWAVMVKPQGELEAEFAGGEGNERPGLALATKSSTPAELVIYLGPVEADSLKSADPILHNMMYAGIWFWLRWICMGLLWLFTLIHGFVPSWALAIMLLSLVVHLLMRPLSRIADRLQDDVHATEARLAPQLRDIQANYKGGEQSERILALYKDNGVHPLYSLKSLAGVAVIIPVFIGAFDMLAENIWLAGESFLWISDLARPDSIAALPFRIPFFGGQLNLLPFVMTGLTVAASLLHRHEDMDDIAFRKHKRNLTLMALAFLALFYTFPAGMVLYWTTNNLISVIKYGWQRKNLNKD